MSQSQNPAAPALGLGLAIVGCLTTFYLFGIVLVALGAWIGLRGRRSEG